LLEIFRTCKEFPVLGFDCEWVTVNNERRKVALIQLCSPEGLCGLFRVCKFSSFPPELREILENPEILKVGVTPEMDARLLLQDYSVNVQGTFDLRFIAMQSGRKPGGLAALSKSILNIELDKNWRVRCSDWEIEELSKSQIDYAAKDAFVAVEIFRKLYNEMKLPKIAVDIRRYGNNYSDISFKNKLAQLNLDSSESKKNVKGWQQKLKDIKTLKRSISTRTSPLYDNCRLQAPDGELLCACDQSKAEWYVKKGLATVIENEPVYTVRLNFEPSGRAVADVGEYYCTEKENRCVVCGATDNLLRKNVIPREYRKCFPQVMKDKTSHDIVLLCILCHQKSNIVDNIMRNKLKDICDAPLDGERNEERIDTAKNLRKNQRFANALLKGKNIPEERIKQLKKDLQEAYPGQEIDQEFLTDLINHRPEDPNLNSHGQIVVERFKQNQGILALEKMWREVS
jgi:exonuclease 3'-5' domain-containing protein 2